jgi:hypothetical protein
MGATEQHNEKTCDSFGLTASPRAQVAATAGYLQDFYEFGALLAPFARRLGRVLGRHPGAIVISGTQADYQAPGPAQELVWLNVYSSGKRTTPD